MKDRGKKCLQDNRNSRNSKRWKNKNSKKEWKYKENNPGSIKKISIKEDNRKIRFSLNNNLTDLTNTKNSKLKIICRSIRFLKKSKELLKRPLLIVILC